MYKRASDYFVIEVFSALFFIVVRICKFMENIESFLVLAGFQFIRRKMETSNPAAVIAAALVIFFFKKHRNTCTKELIPNIINDIQHYFR